LTSSREAERLAEEDAARDRRRRQRDRGDLLRAPILTVVLAGVATEGDRV
jgi:hypothetical protein